MPRCQWLCCPLKFWITFEFWPFLTNVIFKMSSNQPGILGEMFISGQRQYSRKKTCLEVTMKLHMKLFYFVGVVLIPVPINAETSHLSTESICQYSSIILSNLSDICCFSFQEVPAHQWFSTRMATLRDDTISSSTRTPTGPPRSTESSALGPISSTSEWDFKHTHTHTEVGEWVKSQKLTSSGLFARSWSLSVSTFYNFH